MASQPNSQPILPTMKPTISAAIGPGWGSPPGCRNAHAHHQRRGRVGACVPRVGHQHARLDLFGHRQHVAKEQFLATSAPRPPTAPPSAPGVRIRGFRASPPQTRPCPRPRRAAASPAPEMRRFQTAGGHRDGLRRVFCEWWLANSTTKIRHQVGQGVDAIGNQALRFGPHPHHDLHGGQHQVDHHADPGAARAAAARSCGVCSVSSVSSSSLKFIGCNPGTAKP